MFVWNLSDRPNGQHKRVTPFVIHLLKKKRKQLLLGFMLGQVELRHLS